MGHLPNRLKRLFLIVAYRCANLILWVTRIPVRGTMVAIWHDGEILLIENAYRKGWTFPGGLVSGKETRRQAAVREVFEEVGIRIAPEALQFVAEVVGDLGPNDSAHVFEIDIASPVDINIDGVEIVRAEFVSPVDAHHRALSEHVESYLKNR